mgnify:CR=1 FL=1
MRKAAFAASLSMSFRETRSDAEVMGGVQELPLAPVPGGGSTQVALFYFSEYEGCSV